jgi:hypothetical protein
MTEDSILMVEFGPDGSPLFVTVVLPDGAGVCRLPGDGEAFVVSDPLHYRWLREGCCSFVREEFLPGKTALYPAPAAKRLPTLPDTWPIEKILAYDFALTNEGGVLSPTSLS